MNLKKFSILCIFLLPISVYATGSDKTVDHTIRKTGEELMCTLNEVDDGDTVDLRCGKKVIPAVRLLAINTPDVEMPANIRHCYYDEARGVMRKISEDQRIVKAVFYGSDLCADRAKGCRNLARLIDIETGYDINERLIESGYAFEWTGFSMVPAQIRVRYKLAEKRAEKNEK
jgi:endonuclease YncB( thermonuclease family)